MTAIWEHFTANLIVIEATSNSIDEPSIVRLDVDEKLKLYEQDSLNLNSTVTSPKAVIQIPTETYIDSLSEND